MERASNKAKKEVQSSEENIPSQTASILTPRRGKSLNRVLGGIARANQ